jgi:RNA polymerase sigma-B factor
VVTLQPARAKSSEKVALMQSSGSTSELVDYASIGPLLTQLAEHHDESARARVRQQILISCLPLAEHIARRYRGRGESAEDLYQVACVGLIGAVDRYDVTRGSDFLSFAVPTIMGELRRHFRDHVWAMHVPRGDKENIPRLRSAVEVLSQRLGRSPTVREIAVELDIAPADVRQAAIANDAYRPRSIDSMSSDDSGQEGLMDRYGSNEAAYEHVEQHLTVRALIAALPERERTILTMRFFESSTQTQIAGRVGVSQMQVSRILAKSLRHLRRQAVASRPPCRLILFSQVP